MPANLREAHDRNDETLERIYIGRRFKNDTERLEKLFELYSLMTSRQASTNQPVKRKPSASCSGWLRLGWTCTWRGIPTIL